MSVELMAKSFLGTLQEEAEDAVKRGDYEQGLILNEKLATLGSAFAMIITGRFYLHGIGTKINYEKARYWFEKAYERGDLSGALWLHGIYYYGNGVPINYHKALTYAKAFQRIENPKTLVESAGLSALAAHYELGRGVPKDTQKAMTLNHRAMRTGHLPSKLNYERRRVLRGNILAIPTLLVTTLRFMRLEKKVGGRHKDPRLW